MAIDARPDTPLLCRVTQDQFITTSKLGLGCLIAFLTPFALVGVFSLAGAIRQIAAGQIGDAAFMSIFAIMFGGVGVGGIFFVIRAHRRHLEHVERLNQLGDEPWRIRDDWASGVLTHDSKATMLAALGIAAFWNVIAIPGGLLAALEAIRTDNPVLFIPLLFPLIGIGLMIWAAREVIGYRKFGRSTATLSTVPGVIGRRLAGEIRTGSGLMSARHVDLALRCVRRITTGSGKNRSTREEILWEGPVTQQHVRREGHEASVPFAFTIPPDAQQSDLEPSSDHVLWRLSATADVPGVDYRASFEVPVFRTAESNQPLPHAVSPESPTADPSSYTQPANSRITVTTTRRGTEIYLPPARNPGAAATITVFALIFGGVAVLLTRLDAPSLFTVIFGLVSIALLWATLDAWLGTSRIEANRDGVRRSRGILWIRRTRWIGARDVAEVIVKPGMTSGSVTYQDVNLKTTDGSEISLASAIRDKQEAEWLAWEIGKAVSGAQ